MVGVGVGGGGGTPRDYLVSTHVGVVVVVGL